MSSQIGALTLPVPAGDLNSDLDDPVVSGIASYLRFWLRNELNDKLANIQGTSADALPEDNVFLWNPANYMVRGRQDGALAPFPALYVWWDGKSGREDSRSTLLYDARKREVHVLYVFEEVTAPGALQARHGLLNAVDSVFFKAIERWRHEDYTPEGLAPGSALYEAFPMLGWNYEGGTPGFMSPIPAASGFDSGRDDGAVTTGFPSLKATIMVWERVGSNERLIPDDVLGDSTLTINASDGESANTTEFMTRILPAPDGSETP